MPQPVSEIVTSAIWSLRAVLTVTDGNGKTRWDTSPQTDRGELPLDFAAAGLPVSIRQGESVFFTGTVPAAGPGVGDGDDDNGTPPPPGLVSLTPTAAAPAAAKAEAEVEFGVAGVASLEVELEDLPAGDYEVLVGNEIFYTDDKASFLLMGALVDLKTRENVTDLRMRQLNRIDFASLPL